MKKLFLFGAILGLFLGYNTSAIAEAVGGGSGTITQLPQWLVSGGYIKAASSTAGIWVPSLGSASNCVITDSSGKFSTSVCSGAGGTYPFTPSTNYGITQSATTSAIWGKIGFYGSSTSYFTNLTVTGNATTTNATSTFLYVSNALSLANALTVANGGTGAISYGQGWVYSSGGTGALAASTSPTVNYITSTSTTATSTFGYGINATAGCFAIAGTCLNTIITNSAEYKQAVLYGTAVALASNNYVAGVITEIGNGALSVDGSSPSVGDRILVKNEGTTANNGIYTVTAAGSGIAVFVLTRATDFDSSSEVYSGVCTHIISGTVNANSNWCLDNVGAVTIGSTGLTFSEAGDGAAITALTGDVTATGPASAAATLATVNSNVGSFGGVNSIPAFTVNGKGLITAASGNTPSIPASEITSGTFGSGNYTFPAVLTLSGAGVANQASFQNFSFVNATGTQATTTNHWSFFNFADLTQSRTFTATGTGVGNQSSFQNFTAINSTSTQATSTNSWCLFCFGDLTQSRTLTATGTGFGNQSSFQWLTLVNSTSTAATTTSFYSSLGITQGNNNGFISATTTKAFNIASTTLDASGKAYNLGTSTFLLMNDPRPLTLLGFYCTASTTGTIVVNFYHDNGNKTEAQTCTSGAFTRTLTNNTFTANENFNVQASSTQTTPPSRVTITPSYFYNSN